ncbi:TetR/AcrR family transcriptional regulator [Paenibacillus hodogayensis]|uniref:TetR/AcrR family transcriptional regulator n=1 Tax=Paenibacillus hodogayensis TaxID=279208 RepID=A0ABV5VZI1_9BACL
MTDNRVKDRRIVRTRSMITDALLALLQKRAYAEISIIDITEQANINRSTFYAHYIDKDDLLNKMIDEKLDRLIALGRFHQASPASTSAFNEPDPYYVALFEHLGEHDIFYRVMLDRPAAGDFNAKMQDIIKSSFFSRISNMGLDQKLQVPLDILLDYIGCSTQGVIATWLFNNRMYSPHYMALQLTRLSSLGIYSAMGIEGASTR